MFGSSNCSDHNTWYQCSAYGMYAGVDAIGYVVTEDSDSGYGCSVDAGGSGRCYLG